MCIEIKIGTKNWNQNLNLYKLLVPSQVRLSEVSTTAPEFNEMPTKEVKELRCREFKCLFTNTYINIYLLSNRSILNIN